jgi:hypothetical protein
VYITDPIARLRYVRQSMDGLKQSKQAVGAATLARATNRLPPTVLAQASRLNFSTRLFNLLVTNIPGPQVPLYVLGRRLDDLLPVAFLPDHHALAVAIMSYNGAIDYGLLGDYDALPDIDVIAHGIDEALAELLAAARSRSGGAGPRKRSATGSPAAEPGSSEAGGNGHGNGHGHGNGSPPAPKRILPESAGRPTHGPAADMRAKRARARTSRRPQT